MNSRFGQYSSLMHQDGVGFFTPYVNLSNHRFFGFFIFIAWRSIPQQLISMTYGVSLLVQFVMALLLNLWNCHVGTLPARSACGSGCLTTQAALYVIPRHKSSPNLFLGYCSAYSRESQLFAKIRVVSLY